MQILDVHDWFDPIAKWINFTQHRAETTTLLSRATMKSKLLNGLNIVLLFVSIHCMNAQRLELSPTQYGVFNHKAPPHPDSIDPYFVETRDIVSTRGPVSITRNILQDRKGNMWFATWQGIMSYDGKEFTNHTLQSGLKHFHVFSALEDRAGHLWFGTIRGGAYRFDGRTFKLFNTLNGLPNNEILCFFEDRSGNLWIGTDNGVARYDGREFKSYTVNDGLSGRSVNSIAEDQQGRLWFATRYGERGDLCYFDGKTFTSFRDKEKRVLANVRSVVVDRTGLIWIGGQDGLFTYDGSMIKTISEKFIGYIFEDRKGKIWLSYGNGDGTMSFGHFDGNSVLTLIEKRGAQDVQVFGITQDREDRIWFGSMRGASMYDGKTFRTFD
jgi:ligand-binding sensor domain-containing protein